MIDLAVAVPGLVVALPVILVAVALIRVTSAGPAIFVQTRIGRNGAPFRCYKLRTMAAGTPAVPTHEAQKSAVTPVGQVLRRTKLDELPQLWNVLRGEMAVVGPRPCLPTQEELIRERARRGVLAAAPGITGLAQVRGIDMSQPVLLAETDAEYLRNWSVRLDLELMLRTVWRGS
ncbi:sugar transferase [Chelativorans sp. AA-79]|uniref:sugar transferase n=1 Tax=Chelativorans sp. AA-79 TaxID=3028735 RepID=UPI0023F6EE11|nr:sugar transferase [Chelativorans sp. AA-79]WEX11945.1 sugar transferase [Chelativorans sp. AA-79]